MGSRHEAVEAQGWALYHMCATEGKALSGDGSALICLFRRAHACQHPSPTAC
ncbi:hypothetical protein STRAU_1773 [Streptomyces aurantiacus JA 4570]|uniref:Uncharacterized protein n=1 Tax=Streptomyces aurantiacus JA 4570 TaxID=1286094 RepID=S4A367_9ACTN|nr:hypothetical protein STRAU_1773 [Streptomyces aurantiacus JA 4570]